MLIAATIKKSPDDFVVEELPLYLPSGTGEHVYVTFEKRGIDTFEAVRELARALGANARDAGIAGMKDKHAVTRQTISLMTPRGQKAEDLVARATTLALPGIRVLSAARHGNKLKTGHLAGNRFEIVVRDIALAELPDACDRLRALEATGVPNAFGEQRFGRHKDNADRARAWLRGDAPAPRDPRKKRLLYSALQSALFNAVLDRRVADGTWRTPLLGDVLKKTDSGGMFVCADVQVDTERASRGEVTPTGPMLGPKMVKPEGLVAELEARIAADFLGADEIVSMLTNATGLGEGTRRTLVLPVTNLTVEPISPAPGEERGSCRVYFVIPKGAYATTVLGQVFAWNEVGSTETNPAVDASLSSSEESHRDD